MSKEPVATKKVRQRVPNQLLKTERELRGWSQKYVADQIGADHYYLSRWELGTAFPSPYYRQKLCVLFGKTTKELGLLQQAPAASDDAQDESERPSATPGARVHDPAIPPLLIAATGLVGRDDALTHLKERLCAGKNVGLTALNGLPGVGKTTLAVALAHDEDVLHCFHDGILWAGLGPQPNVLGLLSRWGTLLGTPTVAAAKLTSIEAWTHVIRAAIDTRQMLLIVDDAWEIEEALAFRVGGPRCAYLVTTRFPQIALQFAGEGVLVVRELSADDGFTLLERLVPEMVASDPEAAQTLVQSSGGLPLALNLMGKYLRSQTYGGQTRRMRTALERLHDARERLLLSEPQAHLERSATLPAGTPLSLQTIISVSEQRLDEQARLALRRLAVFPAKPNTFSEEAALAVCQVPVDVLDTLTDTGLVESVGAGRYTLHQTIADYARVNLTDLIAYERLTTYFADYVTEHTKDYEALEQESSNIFAALEAASKLALHANLIRCISTFAGFLQAHGLYAQAEAYLTQAEQAAQSLQDNTSLSVVLLHLGRIQFNRRNYDRSEASLREGLACARRSGDQAAICQLLQWLGTVARYRGEYQRAEMLHREGLALARQADDHVQTSALLTGIGTDAWEQGHYDQAEEFLQKGVALARQAGDRERLCETLVNCGTVAYMRGNYAQGDRYSLEALEIARHIGYRQAVATLLGNLGEIATDQANYTQAETYIREALQIARQMENLELISANLLNLGRLAMEQADDAQAETYLREVLQNARQLGRLRPLFEVLQYWGEFYLKRQQWSEAAAAFGEVKDIASGGNEEYLAIACFGLARVAAAQGKSEEARTLGQESLRLAETIGIRLTSQVRAWLDAGSFLSDTTGTEK